jgi:two-component system chemotaxis response regulator CheB
MIRTLIVDDSATMRGLIAAALSNDPQIEIVGQAADPLEARAAIKALNPDVITLDVEMPNMNGLEFLEKLMRLRPMPVIMVSTLTSRGAEATLTALELGAFDCICKPISGGPITFEGLVEKVKAAGKARMRPTASSPTVAAPLSVGAYTPNGHVLAIGSSTGGVEALIAIISRLPANCPPTLITQHMPASFTKSFAERLNRISAAEVSEASPGAPVGVGRVVLAPGGPAHLELQGGTGGLRCRVVEADLVNGHRPSVDVLFDSVARTVGGRALGVILTGMGRDGAKGLLAMREAGARTLGQDEASSVVYGMPKAAFEIGAVQRQLSLEKIAPEIVKLTNLNHGDS